MQTIDNSSESSDEAESDLPQVSQLGYVLGVAASQNVLDSRRVLDDTTYGGRGGLRWGGCVVTL